MANKPDTLPRILRGSAPDYIDDELALVDDVRNIDFSQARAELSEVTMLIFIYSGQMRIEIDGESLALGPMNILLCTPGHRVGMPKFSHDFTGHALVSTLRYTQRLITLTGNIWNYLLELDEYPVIKIPDGPIEVLQHYYRLLLLEVNRKHNIYYKETVSSIIRAMMCTLVSDLRQSERVKAAETRNSRPSYSGSTQSLALFHRFMELLSQEVCTVRRIEPYAAKLCVTPKYLSTVCTRVSQRSAHYWITNAVVNSIDKQLRYSDKSIKEIAMLYDFPNLAFFSKYVKKHLGVSPSDYRKK